MRLIDADKLIENIENTADLGGWIGDTLRQIKRLAVRYINSAPSIDIDRPQEWIPCSERLPRYDETSEYLVTDKEGRLRHCCLDPYMPETFVTVEEGMIVDAVAWRPAPKPWRPGND